MGIGLGGLAAMVFPELASARSSASAAASGTAGTPWQWQARDARAATDGERAKYLPLFESDLEQMERRYGARMDEQPPTMSVAESVYGTVVALGTALVTGRIYARHVELSPNGAVVRAATTTFAVSGDMKTVRLDAMGTDARSAITSRAQFDATAAKSCPSGKHSCHTCNEFNNLGILACCGGCAFAGNGYLLLACAVVMCSLCMSQNCRSWTYACCGV
jgi:hypothetical protein